jgi:hypothetical protein
MRTTGSVCGSKLASRKDLERDWVRVQAVLAPGKRLFDDEAQEPLQPVRRDEIGARQDPLQLSSDHLGRRRELSAQASADPSMTGVAAHR